MQTSFSDKLSRIKPDLNSYLGQVGPVGVVNSAFDAVATLAAKNPELAEDFAREFSQSIVSRAPEKQARRRGLAEAMAKQFSGKGAAEDARLGTAPTLSMVEKIVHSLRKAPGLKHKIRQSFESLAA